MKNKSMLVILLCSVILNLVFLTVIEILHDQYIVLRSDYFDTAKPIGKYYSLTCKDVSALKKMLLKNTEEVNLERTFSNQYFPDGSYNKAKHADLIINALEEMQERRTRPVK